MDLLPAGCREIQNYDMAVIARARNTDERDIVADGDRFSEAEIHEVAPQGSSMMSSSKNSATSVCSGNSASAVGAFAMVANAVTNAIKPARTDIMLMFCLPVRLV